jgi:hypothetical protein
MLFEASGGQHMPRLTRKYGSVNDLIGEGETQDLLDQIQQLLDEPQPAETVEHRISYSNGDYRLVTVRNGQILLGGVRRWGWNRAPWPPTPEMEKLALGTRVEIAQSKKQSGRLVGVPQTDTHTSRLIGG